APVTGLQFIEYRQANVTHSATGLLTTPPILNGRLFVEVTSSVKTQLSIANASATDANVDLFFTDDSGNSSGFTSITVPAGGQFSGNVGEGLLPLPGATGTSTLSFTASVPVSVAALRTLTNSNTISVISPTPVANVDNATAQPITIPQFADGGGWTSQI